MKFPVRQLPLLLALAFQSQAAFGSELSNIDEINDFDSSFSRNLVDTGTNCRSSAKVTCTLGTLVDYDDANKPNVPCQGNIRAKKSACDSGNSIIIPITITWEYCNLERQYASVAKTKRTTAKYRGWLKPEMTSADPLTAGTCRRESHEKDFNVCTMPSAAMEMRFEGKLPDKPVTTTYCYAYSFLKVRRTWIPEDERCSVSSKVYCEINGGDKDGEPCEGNVVRVLESNGEPRCEDVSVKFTFQHCYWSPTGAFVYQNQNNNDLTKIKIKGEKKGVKDKSLHRASDQNCRFQTETSFVNTCSKRLAARLYVDGNLQGDSTTCEAYDFLEVYPDEICEYKFYITEIADPENNDDHRFLEIKTENCGSKVVLDDIFIVRFRKASKNPYSNVISLKGRVIPDDGFFVFCATNPGRTYWDGRYGEGTCDEVTLPDSAAGTDGEDQIAIIKGDPSGPSYEILDIYGFPGETGRSTPRDFQDGRVVRRPSALVPNNQFNLDDWLITKPANSGQCDPRALSSSPSTPVPTAVVTNPPTPSPTNFPTPVPTNDPGPDATNPPTALPTNFPTRVPTNDPGPDATNPPTALPTNFPTPVPTEDIGSGPSPCVYDFIITELSAPNGYVEIFTDKCKGRLITDDVFITLWDNNAPLPSSFPINLKDMTIPDDGVLLFCATGYNDTGDEYCEAPRAPANSPADTDGDDEVAIIVGPVSNPTKVLDRYGNPSRSPKYDYTNGRAQRKPWATTPQSQWVPNEWVVFPGDGKTKMPPANPGVKPEESLIITELTDPVNSSINYIELYSYNMGGKTLPSGMFGVNKLRSTGSDTLSLGGVTIPDDGFYIICNEPAKILLPANTCDEVDDVAKLDGGDLVVVTKNGDPYDKFGNTPNGLGTEHDFQDGRAMRKIHATANSPSWNPDIWDIIPGDGSGTVGVDDLDPGVWNDSNPVCDYDVLIAEVVDPLNYIEVQATDECIFGKTIEKDLYLNYYRTGSTTIDDYTAFSLKGLSFDANGFLIICASSPVKLVACTVDSRTFGPANADGSNVFVLLEDGKTTSGGTIVDIYGTPGQDCSVENHCFVNGRAGRKSIVDDPNKDFDLHEWILNVPVSTDDSRIDPGQRIDNPGGPSPTTPSPTSAPTGGKGGKNSGKNKRV